MSTDNGIYKAYKHRTVKTFKVGRFKFEDHILKIHSEAEHEEFLKAYEGLLGPDRVAIVEVMQLENERPVNTQRRVDGSLSTAEIKDHHDTNVVAKEESAPVTQTTEPAPNPVPPASGLKLGLAGLNKQQG